MRKILGIAAVVLGISLAIGLVLRTHGASRWIVDEAHVLGRDGATGVIVFAVVYVLAAVAFVPYFVLAIPVGLEYGFGWGLVFAIPLSLVSAWLAFALGRGALRHRLEARFHDSTRVAALDDAVHERGFWAVTLLRLAPMLPFAAINYLLSITGVRTRSYLAGTALGMLPWTALYVYTGAVATDAVGTLRGSATGGFPLAIAIALAVAFAACSGVSWLALHAMHRSKLAT